jgi:hypothetical protein
MGSGVEAQQSVARTATPSTDSTGSVPQCESGLHSSAAVALPSLGWLVSSVSSSAYGHSACANARSAVRRVSQQQLTACAICAQSLSSTWSHSVGIIQQSSSSDSSSSSDGSSSCHDGTASGSGRCKSAHVQTTTHPIYPARGGGQGRRGVLSMHLTAALSSSTHPSAASITMPSSSAMGAIAPSAMTVMNAVHSSTSVAAVSAAHMVWISLHAPQPTSTPAVRAPVRASAG